MLFALSMAGDAAMFGEHGLAELSVPVMAIGGTADTDSPFEWGTRLTYDNVSSARKVEIALTEKLSKELPLPVADVLIAADQRRHITFDAFFGNTMFHEVAHGLGIQNTLDGKGTVREALQEHASSIEEGKAVNAADYLAALDAAGMPVEPFASYLETFRYGMPPHGGFAVGLERLFMQLLGAPNLRLTTLFPRDMQRVTP